MDRPGPARAGDSPPDCRIKLFKSLRPCQEYAPRLRRGAYSWSEWRDLNPRPLGPEPSAIPNFATPRRSIIIMNDFPLVKSLLEKPRGRRAPPQSTFSFCPVWKNRGRLPRSPVYRCLGLQTNHLRRHVFPKFSIVLHEQHGGPVFQQQLFQLNP